MCGLYILDGSNIIGHAILASRDFNEKNKLWNLRSKHATERIANKCMKTIS